MDYLTEMQQISQECARLAEELEELLPEHDLLRFDARGKSYLEQSTLLDKLLEEFGSRRISDSHTPSNEDLLKTFQNFKAKLESVVVMEKAKLGIFKPLD